MTRLALRVAIAAGLGLLAYTGPAANADVVVSISGTLGMVGYGGPHGDGTDAPLNGGSFSGTVTFASLPAPNTSVTSNSADVNFYDSSNNLVFVGNIGGFDEFTAGPSGYELLSVGVNGIVGSTPVVVASLDLAFNSWPLSSGTGIAATYPDSSIEYSYETGGSGITYYNSVLTAQASVPEPSTLALGLFGVAGVVIYARRDRRIPFRCGR
jgi:hypothetical protein